MSKHHVLGWAIFFMLSACTKEICGDGVVNSGEACDDGNNTVADGCEADCTLTAAFNCGDGTLSPGEQCDDGNSSNTDACLNTCQNAFCGDTFLQTGVEECDDGNTIAGDGCEPDCTAVVLPACGDGNTDAGEECDDGNTLNGDGCSALCTVEVLRVAQVSAGGFHTCALLNNGRIRCWGDASLGRLGYENNNANIGDNEPPNSVGFVDVGGLAIQIAAGNAHTCALLNNGEVRCWGSDSAGQLGYGSPPNNIGDNESPASAGSVDVGGLVTQLAAGQEHTCALLDSGEVRCWGRGLAGRLGYGNTNDIGDDETPSSAGSVALGSAAVQVTSGEFHSCALLNTGEVRCWGNGAFGALGYGNTNNIGDDEFPSSAGPVDVGGSAIAVEAGGAHTCVILTGGAVRCFGEGNFGRLGLGNTERIGDDELPSSVGPVDVGGAVVQLSAGTAHTCALLDSNEVRCWGFASNGQLGYGNTANIGDDEVPALAGSVSVSTVVQLSAGGIHNCAVLDTGALRCWGEASLGRLGYGNQSNIGDNETPSDAGDVLAF